MFITTRTLDTSFMFNSFQSLGYPMAYRYKNSGYFIRVTPEMNKFILESEINPQDLFRFVVGSIQYKDEKIITQLSELMGTRKDVVTKFCKQEQYNKAESFLLQTQRANTEGVSLSDIMKRTNHARH